MNELSWFLYLADVIPRVGTAIQVVAFLLCIASIALFIISMGAWSDDIVNSKRNETPREFHGKYVFIPMVAFFFFLFIWSVMWLVPSRETIYMIAASEAGETVVTSPEAQEMLNDLKTIIKSYIKKD